MSRSGVVRNQTGSRAEAEQRRRVLQVARSLSATLAGDFFHSVVRSLWAALDADCVYLGELARPVDDCIRTLSVFVDASPADNFEQKLNGSAAGQVLADGAFACSRDARRMFPLDAHLQRTAAEGFAGIRLSDSAGLPIGVLALISGKAISDLPLVRSVLEAFAPRAAAEVERKRSDDVHRENEERYHVFVASNPDGMWRVEFKQPIPLDLPEEEQIQRLYGSGYLAECNDAFARLFGRQTAEQCVGLRFEELAPRTDEGVQAELRASVRSGFRATTVERIVSDEFGRRSYRLRSQFGIVEDRQLYRLWGSTRDMTDLRRAELATAASERRFREVLESIHLPAVMLDSQGAVTFCNEEFLKLAQISRTELPAPWLEGIVLPEESTIWKAAALSGDRTSHFEGTIVSSDGFRRMILWDTICLRNPQGEILALAAIGRDLTYLRVLEAQLREAQMLDSVGRLAAGVAHDFNNLLAVILGHSSQLLETVSPADRLYDGLSKINSAATFCAKLTEELMAFGRRGRLRPARIDLNGVIDGAEVLIRSVLGDKIELTIDRAPDLWSTYADPTQIGRALTNLVSNARDAMPDGGKVAIITSNREIGADEAERSGIPGGTYIQLSVTDTGPGLTPEVRKHIFEPFFTTKQPGRGTGLGLATVYGIVTQSGGFITVDSKAQRGARFDILLPAATTN